METWRPVAEFLGYEVSSEGRVRSLDRVVECAGGRQLNITGRVLKLFPSGSSRYWTVSLRGDGKNQTRFVHRLVAIAFLGEPAAGLQCCHNNGDGRDNRVANLRWDTPAANSADKVAHGTNLHSVCKRGHALTQDNVWSWQNQRTGELVRYCATCRNRRLNAA